MCLKRLIEKLDSAVLRVDFITNYLEQFKDYEIIYEEIEEGNGEIVVHTDNDIIKLVFLDIGYAKWWTVYRMHSDGTRYEQVDTLLYNGDLDRNYNCLIKYSAHMEDQRYSYIRCSGHSYLDDQLVQSWQENRVVPVEDLSKIQYCKNMNLTELIGMTDEKSSHIIKKESLKNVKTLVLSVGKIPNIH